MWACSFRRRGRIDLDRGFLVPGVADKSSVRLRAHETVLGREQRGDRDAGRQLKDVKNVFAVGQDRRSDS